MSVRYKSTRGAQKGLTFEQVVLGGLASDKGLYIPETIPQFSQEKIQEMRKMSFSDLAYEVISSFVQPDQIPAAELKSIIHRSFSSFRTNEVTANIKLKDTWILELFHGPTFAFKDVALQFLGNVFEFFLQRGRYQRNITILGATSGDTGSAAIHGLRGKANVDCFIMYPNGKVTTIQEKQMTTIPDTNVHCLRIDGDFDACQAIVKAAFADETFRKEVNLGAINSINWARVLAQITYYFYSWLRVTDGKSPETKISFAVPTGNFGDILAGFYAKKMGLFVDKLIVCTNENDVLHRFLTEGVYKKNPAVLTIAPSMDISVSSNFERYLFYLLGESAEILAEGMSKFEATGELVVSSDLAARAREDFLSSSSTKPEILSAMTTLFRTEGYLVCPHTATAIDAVKKLSLPADTTVCLATAHPAKFEEAVRLSIPADKIPDLPEALAKLFTMTTHYDSLPNSLTEVQTFVRAQKIAAEAILRSNSAQRKCEWNIFGGSSGWCNAATVTTGVAMLAALGFVLYKQQQHQR